MAIALSAVASDGKLNKPEVEKLRMMPFLCPLFKDVEYVDPYILAVARFVGTNDTQKVLEASAKVLTPSLKETAFAWAVQMVHADGKVVPQEHKLLNQIIQALGLNGELAGKIRAIVPMLSRTK